MNVNEVDLNIDLKATYPIVDDQPAEDTVKPVRYRDPVRLSWTSTVNGGKCWLITTIKDDMSWDLLDNPNEGFRDVTIYENADYRFRCSQSSVAAEDTIPVSVYIPPGHIALTISEANGSGGGNREIGAQGAADVLTVNQGAQISLDWAVSDVSNCQASWDTVSALESVTNDTSALTKGISPLGAPATKSQRFNIFCEDILGNIVSDTATLNVTESLTIDTALNLPPPRSLSFDINLCSSTGQNCTDYYDESITLKKQNTSGVYEVIEPGITVGDTLDLRTYDILDADMIAFQASLPSEQGTSFRELRLPNGEGDPSESDPRQIEVRAICLFDHQGNSSCNPISSNSFKDKLFGFIFGNKAEAIIDIEHPTVVADYQSALGGCFIDVMTIEQAGIVIPPDPDTSFESETGEGVNFARRVLDWLNPTSRVFAQILPTVLVVDPGQELFLTWHSIGDSNGRLKGSGTLTTSSDFPDEVIGDEGTYTGPYHAPAQNGTYSYTLECTGTDGSSHSRSASVKVVSGFSLSAEPDEMYVHGLTGPANACVALTVEAESGFLDTVSFDASSTLGDKLEIAFTPPTISLPMPPGESATTKMCVTLLSRAARGIYGLEVTAESADANDSVIVDLELQNIANEEVVEF